MLLICGGAGAIILGTVGTGLALSEKAKERQQQKARTPESNNKGPCTVECWGLCLRETLMLEECAF